MTVYVDVTLCVNIIMNYIIILTTNIICKTQNNIWRFLFASIIGAIYSIFCLVYDLEFLQYEFIKLCILIIMNVVAFDIKKIKKLIKHVLVFLMVSFCFGGLSYYLIDSKILNKMCLTNNRTINMLTICVSIGFFFIIFTFKMLKNHIEKNDLICNIEINYKNKNKKINVLLDTGNLLQDPITHMPVVIIEKNALTGVVPQNVLEYSDNLMNNKIENMNFENSIRCNIIPFSTIGKKNGIILGFKPDYMKAYYMNEIIKSKIIIGIYNEKISKDDTYSGLIGLNALR